MEGALTWHHLINLTTSTIMADEIFGLLLSCDFTNV